LNDWEAIVRDNGPMAYDTAWRILGNASDTEDAVQEAFMDALRLSKREPAVQNWGGMLRRLAARRAIDLLRQRRSQSADRIDTIATGAPADPSAVAAENELAARLRAALADLPPRQAEVFSMRYFGDLQNSEIAQALEIDVGAVAVALHKARARLESILQTIKEHP
jgi:RNA polymerase sigma-70 factor (ECF subfamily)